MNNNFCTSCGEVIPEGVHVCGRCLKKSEGSEVHRAVRVLENHCKESRVGSKGCDSCILRHHCENKVSHWQHLFLETDLDDYEIVNVPRKGSLAKVNKKKISNWLSKNYIYVYVAVALVFAAIIFSLGCLVGQAIENHAEKVNAAQAVVEQSKINYGDESWYIQTGGDFNG